MGCQVSGVREARSKKLEARREQPLFSVFSLYKVPAAFQGLKRNARVMVSVPNHDEAASRFTACLSYLVLRTSYLKNTRSLLRRDDGLLNRGKGNTRFLAALEIEVATVIVAAHPSLRFGMTSFLRRSCYKVPSTFPVPEPNDVVIVPAPSYAGSSPKQKAQGKRQHQHGTYRRLTKQLCHPFGASGHHLCCRAIIVSPLRGFAGIFVFAGL